jgi:hypothetical protein
MTLLQAIQAEEMEDYEEPSPGKSLVLFEVVDDPQGHAEAGRTYLSLGIEEVQGEGGSYDIENDHGFLEYTIAGLVPDWVDHAGWYVIEGFYGDFTRDYYGEVDCKFSYDVFRRATHYDLAYFGIAKMPWWARVAYWFGWKIEK